MTESVEKERGALFFTASTGAAGPAPAGAGASRGLRKNSPDGANFMRGRSQNSAASKYP
ncbi:MAG: hypothetical protein AAB734_03340 [Patescibacteria group bacterium]